MSTLEQLTRGLERTWDQLGEGWRHLRERADHALTRFNPRRDQELETAADRTARQGARWGLLAADVEENEREVTVRLEVPGLERDDLDIHVLDDFLVVRGEKRLDQERSEGRWTIRERAYGQFERAIPLPAAVEEADAKARYRRGVLTVTLPKSKAHTFRRINVEG